MERRSFTLDVKGLDEEGVIEGIAAGYNNVDLGGDRILPGAFSEWLDGKAGVPMLLYHDQQRPVGRWSEFRESADGLFVRGKIARNTRDGGEAYELVKSGALGALSIGYDPLVKRMAGKVRELVKLALHEVSLVTIGMNPNALVTGVKEIEDLRNRIAAGERLTEREWEALFKDRLGLTNAEAERAVRVHNLKIGQGEPDEIDPMAAFWAAIRDAPIVDLTGEPD